ncbi:MAG: DNA repair protein RadA, partial [Anaerolineales bacterium]
MPKIKTQFVCQQCGRVSVRDMGRCPQCGSWNSFVEEVIAEPPPSSAKAKTGL